MKKQSPPGGEARGRHRFMVRAASLATGLLTVLGFSAAFAAAPASAATPKSAPHAIPTTNLAYTPVSPPVRIADTRAGEDDCNSSACPQAGKTLTGSGSGESLTVDIPSYAGVPSDAGAIVAELTAINPTEGGYLTAFPAGSSAIPASGTNAPTSNVNFTAGDTVGNLITIGLGTDTSTGNPAVTIFNGPSGNTDFTLDVEGYYATQSSTSGDAFVPEAPVRVLDTRSGSPSGSGVPASTGTLKGAGSSVTFSVTNVNSDNVPASAGAVALNIGVTDTNDVSYLTCAATGAPASETSTIFWNTPGATLSNQAVVGLPLNGSGSITCTQPTGTNVTNSDTDVIVDVDGYYTGPGGTGALYNPLASPTRLLDTRPTAIAAGSTATATVSGTNASAGALNITDIANGGNYLTAYPAAATAPTAANVNYFSPDPSNTLANGAYVATGTGGVVDILTAGSSANILVDEDGFFAAPVSNATLTVSPNTAQSETANSLTASSSAISYTASGLGTTDVCVALFPLTGSNAPVNSNGTWTFPNSGAGLDSTNTAEAAITTVNGVATGNVDETSAPVVPTSGSVTFVLNSASVDTTLPVVFASTSGACTFSLGSNDEPTVAFGVGGSATWSAPAATAGTYGPDIVTSVNNTAGTFSACPAGASTADADYLANAIVPVTGANCFTFTDNGTGDTYSYPDPPMTMLSATQFQAAISAPLTASANDSIGNVAGDELAAFTYNPSGPTLFTFDGAGTNGDVPAAPTALAAAASTSPAGVGLTWTAPPNSDVSSDAGYAASSGSAGTYYKVYRATVTSGTVGTYSNITASLLPCSTAAPACAVDPTATAGTTYSYVVSAVAGAAGGGLQGPVSTATQFTPATTAAAAIAPLSVSTGEAAPTGATTLVSGTSLDVTFNGTVTLASSSFSLTLTDGAGDVASINSTDATATLTSVGGGTDNEVIYALTGAPIVTTGSAPSLTDLEALNQSGVSNSVGPWNVPGSAASNLPGVTRIFKGTNAALAATGAPTVTPVTTSTTTVSGTCTGTDTVTVYTENGTSLGTGTCAVAVFAVTVSQTVTAGTPLLVTQTPTGGYEGAATEVVGLSPDPIGTGATGTTPSAIAITASQLPGSDVWLAMCSATLAACTGASAAPLGAATVPNVYLATPAAGTTTLAPAVVEFAVPASGSVPVSYTPKASTAAGEDTLTAQNAAAGPTFQAEDTYTY